MATSSHWKVKANWDAAANIHVEKTGICVVIQDYEGNVVVCLSAWKSFRSQPIFAKCWAHQRVMELCSKMGYDQFDLKEIPSLLLMQSERMSAARHGMER